MPRESDHIFKQWLILNRPNLYGLTVVMQIINLFLIFSLVPIINNSSTTWEFVFAIIVPAPILICIFFFLWLMPLRFHWYTSKSIGALILSSPVPSTEIISDMRAWYSTQFIYQALPWIFILGLLTLHGDFFYNREFFLYICLYITCWLIFTFGIFGSVLPSWMTYSGFITFAYALIVYYFSYIPARYIAKLIFSSSESAKIIGPKVHLWLDPPSAWTFAVMSIFLVVWLYIFDNLSIRLFDLKRVGGLG